jgi:O-antigen/teichoic acid export membrane protein
VSAQAAAAAASAPTIVHERRRATFAGAWLLSTAMVVSGVLTYAFHVLAARTLGASAYGQIAILWGGVFVVAIVLFRPLEQTTSRAIADRLARGEEVRTVVRAVGLISVGVMLAICGAAAVAWAPLSSALFDGDGFMMAMLVGGIIAYGLSYLVRGLFGGVRWFNGYGLILLVDSIARLVVAAPLVFVSSKALGAVALLVAALAGTVVPLARTGKRLAPIAEHRPGARFHVGSALAFAAPASAVAGADQLLVNGAPLLVILGGSGGAKAAGVVFAATMLVRAPVYVFQGMAASLLPNFTLLHAGEPARLRQVLKRTGWTLLATGLVIVSTVAVFGPATMQLLYGNEFASGRMSLVLLGAGVSLYLAAATLLQVLLALDRGVVAAIAWSLSAIAFVGAYGITSGAELWRISVAFAGAMALNVLCHAALLFRRGALR